MVKRLLKKHVLKDNSQAPFCSTGCPVMDAGLIDNGPLTPVYAAISKTKETRPSFVQMVGPASNFGLINFQFGKGPLDIWSGGGFGGNLCPFDRLQFCTILTTLRKLVVSNFDQ